MAKTAPACAAPAIVMPINRLVNYECARIPQPPPAVNAYATPEWKINQSFNARRAHRVASGPRSLEKRVRHLSPGGGAARASAMRTLPKQRRHFEPEAAAAIMLRGPCREMPEASASWREPKIEKSREIVSARLSAIDKTKIISAKLHLARASPVHHRHHHHVNTSIGIRLALARTRQA